MAKNFTHPPQTKKDSPLIEKECLTMQQHTTIVDDSAIQVSGYDDGVHVTRSGKACDIYHTDKMAVSYGAEVLVKEYEKPVSLFIPVHRKKPIRTGLYSRRSDNVKRAARDARRIAMANYPLKHQKGAAPVWLTLTYKDAQRGALENRDQVIRDIQVFFRDLRKLYGKQIGYLYSLEVQPKRYEETGVKVLHMHALLFDLPWNDREKIFALWKHADSNGIEMKRLKVGHLSAKENVAKLSKYITKKVYYMLKEGYDVENNKKVYTVSHGLAQPVRWSRPSQVRHLLSLKKDEGYTRKYIGNQSYYSPHYREWFTVSVWEPA